MRDKSQTNIFISFFLPYLKGDGVDIGFGGRGVLPTSINIDLPNFEVKHGNDSQHLSGDAKELYWFNTEVLDYVYSSHCLEDFLETRKALVEWIRVLKVGGVLALLLPDQQRFLKESQRLRGKGDVGNAAHKHATFGLEFVKNALVGLKVEIVQEKEFFNRNDENDREYNFAIVLRKVK